MSDYLRNIAKVYSSSLYKKGKSKGLYANNIYDSSTDDGITQSEKELLPFLSAEVKQQEQEISLLTPLEVLFDFLSLGQYAGANIAQDIAEEKPFEDVLVGGLKGLTAQRKGDWTTTLFGGKDPGEENEFAGIIPGHPLGGREGKIPVVSDIPIVGDVAKDWESTIGLLANIFLDPSTYFTWGLSKGATVANKASAKYGAKEVLKRSLLDAGNIKQLSKITSKGFSESIFTRLMNEDMEKAGKYLAQHVAAKDLARFNNNILKDAGKRLLTSTPEKFASEMQIAAAKWGEDFTQKAVDALASQGTASLRKRVWALSKASPGQSTLVDYLKTALKSGGEIPVERLKDVYRQLLEEGALKRFSAGDDLFKNILSQASRNLDDVARYSGKDFAVSIGGLGERKVADLFGIEIGKGVRRPNVLARTSEKIKSTISGSKFGQYAAALSAKMDDGIVGTIKRAFGIRNEYQQMLNEIKLESHYHASQIVHDEVMKIKEVFGDTDDKTKEAIVQILDYGKTHKIQNYVDLMTDPNVSKMLVDTDPKKVANFLLREREIVQDYFLKESDIAKKGYMAGYVPLVNYLPSHSMMVSRKRAAKELGPFRPGFTKQQTMSKEMIAKQDMAMAKTFLGVDDATARAIVYDLGWSSTTMDLEEMLMYRAYAHARAMANADLVERFIPFGVQPDLLHGSDVAGALGRTGENAFAGLRQVQTEIPALKDVFFDKDVADIIDRVIPVASSDRGLNQLSRAVKYVTTMFKNYATLSPGFNIRNWKTNIITGIINMGVGYANPRRHVDGALLSAYGLWGEAGMKKLSSKLGLTEYATNTLLNRRVGGKTMREWTDDVLKTNGIISKASMGYNLDEFIEEIKKTPSLIQKINPFNPKGALFEGNKAVGAVLESSSRTAGFFYDLEKMVGKTGEIGTGQIEQAIRDVKRIWFDYEDLTEVEKKLKMAIPFYKWLRSNIALQFRQLIENRGSMSAIAKIEGAQRDKSINQMDLPEYVREQGGYATGKDEEGLTRVRYSSMPYGDVNQIPLRFEINEAGIPMPKVMPEDALNNFLSMSHPLFKTFPTLIGKGWDPFTRRQLDSKSIAPRAFRLLTKNPQVFEFIDALFRGFGFKEGIGLEADDDGKLRMNAQAAKLLEDNFMLLRRIDDVSGVMSSIFPELERTMSEMTGLQDKYEDKDRLLKAISFTLGIRQQDFNLDKEEEYRFRDALKRAEEARSEALRKTPAGQKRSEDYYKRAQKRIARLRRNM